MCTVQQQFLVPTSLSDANTTLVSRVQGPVIVLSSPSFLGSGGVDLCVSESSRVPKK